MKDLLPAVWIEDLTVAYSEKPVLWDIDLEIPKGALMAIIGPNGAGKSTLIKAMIDLIRPISGSVEFFGKTYREQRKKIAYVPQRGSVDWDYPINVRDLVLMGRYGHLGFFRRPSTPDRKLCMQALEQVNMTDFADRQISQLSGGQQQRAFLARALVQDSEIYFMDEPFQGIDAKTEKSIITILKNLSKQGKTVIVVHHDLQTVEEYFDHVALIHVKKIASGKTSEVFTRENINLTYHKTSAGEIAPSGIAPGGSADKEEISHV